MTTETNRPNLLVVENTRSVTIRPAEGVTADLLLELLNSRQVKLDGKLLLHSSTGQLLGQRVFSVNSKDYKIAGNQSVLPELDTLDLYDYNFNNI